MVARGGKVRKPKKKQNDKNKSSKLKKKCRKKGKTQKLSLKKIWKAYQREQEKKA